MKLDVPLQLKYGGIALLCIGPAVVLIAGLSLLSAASAQRWPTTDARITRSAIDVSKKPSGFRRTTTVWSDHFSASIHYEYEVNGKNFTGSRIRLDPSHTSGFDRADAEKWVRRYPVGKTIPIHYSQSHPQQSVIDPTADILLLGIVIAAGLAAIPGGQALRRRARQLQPEIEAADQAPLPATTVQESISQAPPRPMHWLVKTFAIVMGLLFFLFGGLSLPISIRQYVLARNTPGPDAVNHAVHLFMVILMGGVMLLGVWLICRSLKRMGPIQPETIQP